MWHSLGGARFFITGGTGFYGKWLLESIAAANDRFGADVRATILSRDPARCAAEVPHLASRPEFSWLSGDTTDFDFPDGRFDYAFHLATASAAEVGAGGTAMILRTLRGTERVLQFARANGTKRLLFASSGAVYGRQPADLGRIPEDYCGGPDLTDCAAAYGEMKRLSELMCASTGGLECVIARGFSFVGPYLPLTDKFAIGSFIRNALTGVPISISGDGTPVRSYLYAADLPIWLLTLLVRGKPFSPYNVGSDHAIALADLAAQISRSCGNPVAVEIGRPRTGGAAERYVPSIERARADLGLSVRIPLDSALRQTIEWARSLGTAELPTGLPDPNSAGNASMTVGSHTAP